MAVPQFFLRSIPPLRTACHSLLSSSHTFINISINVKMKFLLALAALAIGVSAQSTSAAASASAATSGGDSKCLADYIVTRCLETETNKVDILTVSTCIFMSRF